MSAPTCGRCFSPATAAVHGLYRNGAGIIDYACARHAPSDDDVGTIRLIAAPRRGRDREFRIVAIRPIVAAP